MGRAWAKARDREQAVGWHDASVAKRASKQWEGGGVVVERWEDCWTAIEQRGERVRRPGGM